MGCFSWIFANSDNKRRLKIDSKGYVVCPDNSYLGTGSYDGYGDFYKAGEIGSKDIYALVAIWNRDFLSPKMLRKVKKKNYGDEFYWEKAKKNYRRKVERLSDYRSRKVSEEDMEAKYGKDWLRKIGIDISCYDEQNAALPYPIKIVSRKGLLYNGLPSSDGDPDQGL